MKRNNIVPRAVDDVVVFDDGSTFQYTSTHESKGIVRRMQAQVLKSDCSSTIFPGEFIEVDLPDEYAFEKYPVAVEPRVLSENASWLKPTLTKPVNGKIRIVNESSEPQKVPKGHHFCQIMHSAPLEIDPKPVLKSEKCSLPPPRKTSLYSNGITINTSVLDSKSIDKIHSIHKKYNWIQWCIR